MCVSTLHAYGVPEVKGETLILELQSVISCCMGAQNQIWVSSQRTPQASLLALTKF